MFFIQAVQSANVMIAIGTAKVLGIFSSFLAELACETAWLSLTCDSSHSANYTVERFRIVGVHKSCDETNRDKTCQN